MTNRIDGWANTLSGIGSALGRKRENRFEPNYNYSLQTFADLYDYDWLARRIVDSLPAFALAKGFVSADADIVKAFRRLDKTKTDPQGKLFRALAMGRLQGGALLLIGAKSNAPLEEPIPPNASIEWLDVARRDEFEGIDVVNDPASAEHGQAERYRIIGNHRRRGSVFHATRAILCEGLLPSSDNLKTRGESLGGRDGTPLWLSVLTPVVDTLSTFGLSWEAMGSLVQEASIGVFKMAGLIDLIATENQAAIETRMALLSEGRSVAKSLLLDAKYGEDFTRSAVSFADTPALMSGMQAQVAGAADMPVTVLFKTSPGGLNATGDSDMRQWYDSIQVYQRDSVRPKVEYLFSLIAGREVDFEFPALWEPTEAERAQTRQTNAATDRTWFDMGVLDAEETRNARIADGSLGLDIKAAELTSTTEEPAPKALAALAIPATTATALVTVNEWRAGQGLPPLALPTGGDDPDGYLTIDEFTKAKAPAPAPVPEGLNGGTTEDDAAEDDAAEESPDPETDPAADPEPGDSSTSDEGAAGSDDGSDLASVPDRT